MEILVEKYEEIYKAALGGEKFTPAIKALENIGKLHGYDVQRIEIVSDTPTIDPKIDPLTASRQYEKMMKSVH